MRYVAGQDLNLLERARAVTLSPAADSLLPASRLWDGYGDAVCRHGSNAANPSTTVDLAMLDSSGGDNGNLDTWAGGAPTAWTVSKSGTGDVVQSSPGRGGSGSEAKLNKGTGTAKIIKTYRVRAGERLNIELWLKIAAAGQSKAQLYNPITKRYLTSLGAWQAAQAYFATETVSTSYVQKGPLAFTVEDFKANQGPITYLELTVEDTGSGGAGDFAFVDDVYIWPTWNALVGVGHNIDPGMVSKLRSSTDNFSASDVEEAVVTQVRPAFYSYLSTASAKRYARLAHTGTQSTQAGAIYMAELAVCYLESSLVGQRWEWEMDFLEEEIRNTMRGGHVSATPLQIDERRVLRMTFARRDDASYREVRDDIVRRCRGGRWPAIFVPMDSEDIVIHGRLDSSWKVLRRFVSNWVDDINVSETPLPQVTGT